jgi:hypothetical protein
VALPEVGYRFAVTRLVSIEGGDAMKRSLSEVIATFLSTLLDSDERLTIAQQRLLLHGLLDSGMFSEPVISCLQTAAELAGNEDHLLPDRLRRYRRWYENASREGGNDQ